MHLRLSKHKFIDFNQVGGDGSTDRSLLGIKMFVRRKYVEDHHGFEFLFNLGKREWSFSFYDNRHTDRL